MNNFIDLHTHSVYSEGVLNCEQLLKLAKDNDISILALTDHNTIDGVEEIIELSKEYNIKIIPGVEIYTEYQGQGLHLLGYNFKLGNSPLSRALTELQQDHVTKVKKSVDQLAQQGFKINGQYLESLASKYLGAVHILKMLETIPENIKKMDDELSPEQNNFFGKIFYYLGHSRPAYFEQSELPINQAIDIINKSGGFSSLAHPGRQLTFEQDNIIDEIIKLNLNGLEVLSPYHNWHQIEHYQKLALANNLVMTGGSDYHTDINFSKNGIIERQWDYLKVPFKIINNLDKYLKI